MGPILFPTCQSYPVQGSLGLLGTLLRFFEGRTPTLVPDLGPPGPLSQATYSRQAARTEQGQGQELADMRVTSQQVHSAGQLQACHVLSLLFTHHHHLHHHHGEIPEGEGRDTGSKLALNLETHSWGWRVWGDPLHPLNCMLHLSEGLTEAPATSGFHSTQGLPRPKALKDKATGGSDRLRGWGRLAPLLEQQSTSQGSVDGDSGGVRAAGARW